jgi:hypothetical protein
MLNTTIQVRHTEYGTSPVLVHAHGSHEGKPHWRPIRDAFFANTAQQLSCPEDLTIITCNNGHQAMGIFERSLEHLGLPYQVHGAGVNPWMNSRDKPRILAEALSKIKSRYVLYADSRDAILIGDPGLALQRFREEFSCRMLFGADRINWPPLKEFQRYEDSLLPAEGSDFPYLNGGMWIGETAFCQEFFARAMETPPVEKAPESEQGILKRMLPDYAGSVQLDHHCRIFINIGFLVAPVIEVSAPEIAGRSAT